MPGETESFRILAGAPERSVLFARASTRNPFVQMPAIGTHAVDEEALVLLRDWIQFDLASPCTVAAERPNSPTPKTSR